MENVIFLKLGGSLITDKSVPYRLRSKVLKRICLEIHQAREEAKATVLVAHGGGSFAHVPAKKYQTQQGEIHQDSWEGFARVQNDVAKLNRKVVEALLNAGEKAVSIQPSASCLARNSRLFHCFSEPIERLLIQGIIPVPHGDVCLDESCKKFCIVSTEEIFRFLAQKLTPSRIIMAGKTDGVLDSEGRLIKEITRENFGDIQDALQKSDGVADVTGGMMHKVEISLQMGAEVEIINGMNKGMIQRSLSGERGLGTMITNISHAERKKTVSKKF